MLTCGQTMSVGQGARSPDYCDFPASSVAIWGTSFSEFLPDASIAVSTLGLPLLDLGPLVGEWPQGHYPRWNRNYHHLRRRSPPCKTGHKAPLIDVPQISRSLPSSCLPKMAWYLMGKLLLMCLLQCWYCIVYRLVRVAPLYSIWRCVYL